MPVDWPRVRARLEELQSALEEEHRDPAATAALLRQRARRLAAVPAAVDEVAHTRAVLVLRLGAERYAIPAESVVEVLRHRELTRIPGTPPQIAGVTAWRGEVLSVVDLRPLLRLGGAGSDDRLVVVGMQGAGFGLLADDIEEVAHVDEDAIGPVPIAREPWVRGIAATALLLLDTEALLNDPRLFSGPA